MNIEEERRAFDKWRKECMESGDFPSWIAAKAHAEEMAKPTCVIFQTMVDTHTIKYFDQGRPIEERGFKTEAEAIKWAKNFGYRVVEE